MVTAQAGARWGSEVQRSHSGQLFLLAVHPDPLGHFFVLLLYVLVGTWACLMQRGPKGPDLCLLRQIEAAWAGHMTMYTQLLWTSAWGSEPGPEVTGELTQGKLRGFVECLHHCPSQVISVG